MPRFCTLHFYSNPSIILKYSLISKLFVKENWKSTFDDCFHPILAILSKSPFIFLIKNSKINKLYFFLFFKFGSSHIFLKLQLSHGHQSEPLWKSFPICDWLLLFFMQWAIGFHNWIPYYHWLLYRRFNLGIHQYVLSL